MGYNYNYYNYHSSIPYEPKVGFVKGTLLKEPLKGSPFLEPLIGAPVRGSFERNPFKGAL